MAQINLLPWREERRQELKKEFLSVLGLVAIVGVAVVILGGMYVNKQIEHQVGRNSYLQKHIADLDKEVSEIRELQRKRTQLIERMRVIQELQGNRPVIVRILDQLVRTVPDGVFYETLTAKDKNIALTGVAESNNRVSSLMRRLDGSEWFENPNLEQVSAAPDFGDQATKFNLDVKVELPKEHTEQEQ
ncbi:MAG: pilus assembly protein PilN [Gammaproteobacteria bacterium]|nr:MAG: pilus assembly protein PilN [Gammaproteobacteria bacterium]